MIKTGHCLLHLPFKNFPGYTLDTLDTYFIFDRYTQNNTKFYIRQDDKIIDYMSIVPYQYYQDFRLSKYSIVQTITKILFLFLFFINQIDFLFKKINYKDFEFREFEFILPRNPTKILQKKRLFNSNF